MQNIYYNILWYIYIYIMEKITNNKKGIIMKKHKKWIIGGIVLLLLVSAAGSCSKKEKNSLDSTDSAQNIADSSQDVSKQTADSVQDTPDEELKDKAIGESVTIQGVTVTVNSVSLSETSSGSPAFEVNVTYQNHSGSSLSINPYDWSTILHTGSDKAHVGGDSSFHLENISDGEEWTGIITLWKDDNTEKIKFESSDLNFLEDTKKSATWIIPEDLLNAVPENQITDEDLENKNIGDSVTIYGVTVTVNSVTETTSSSGQAVYEVSVTYKNNTGSLLSINPYDWSSVLHTGSDTAHVGGETSFQLENLSDGEEWTGIVTLWKEDNTEKIKFESSSLNLLKDEKFATWLITSENG